MPLLSDYARRRKINWFITDIPKDARVLELGSGAGWLGDYMKSHGWRHYVGLDLRPPADIVGDIHDWKNLGMEAESFDYIVAFEIIEHTDCFREMFDLLKPGGQILLTSPVPHMDWFLRLLELIGLNQARTSPHDRLVYFDRIPLFEPLKLRTIGFLAQWGKLRKPGELRP